MTYAYAGRRFRAAPDLVLFNSYEASNDMFSAKANVKRSKFYDMFVRNKDDVNCLSCTDLNEHARKRRLLKLAFTERSLKAAQSFMAAHIDRWNELLLESQTDKENWSVTHDMSVMGEYLIFDVMGDLAFGAKFETKEPGPNRLKKIPHAMQELFEFMYPVSHVLHTLTHSS